MSNLFLQENIQQYLTDDITVTAGGGEYVLRNGLWSMDIRPRAYYDSGSGTWARTNNNGSAGAIHVLKGYFLPNTRYVFDFWIDADDDYYNDTVKWFAAGMTIKYTDNSTASLAVTGGDGVGFQHKIVVTPSNKSVSHLTVNYYSSMPTYYRADSYICPFDEIHLYKTGVLETQNITESLTGTKNSEIKPGSLLSTEIIEL